MHRLFGMPDPRDEMIDALRARLSAARDERDRLQDEADRAWGRVRQITSRRSYRVAAAGHRVVAGLLPARPTEARQSAPLPALAPCPRGLLIDVSALDEGTRSGIARVTVELARGLARVEDGVTLVRPTATGLAPAPDHHREVFGGRPTRAGTGPPLLLSATVHPGHLLQPWQRSVGHVQATGGRYVQVIHDLLPITEPDYFPLGMRRLFPIWLDQVVAQADVLVCVSEATRRDLLEVSSARAHAVVPPAPFLSGGDSGGRRDGDLVLTVGTVEPRKGVECLLEAAKNVSGWDRPIRFVLVGRPGWNSDRLIAGLRAAHADPDTPFEWREEVDDSALAGLYRQAAVVLQPSRAEGFGLPLAEALSTGAAILARDIPVFREVVADDSSFFRIDAELPAALQRRIAAPRPSQPARFGWSWDDAAAALLAAIRSHGG